MKKIIIGIDEAGRGPLAGPVVAVACSVLHTRYPMQHTKLRDSKALSPKQREQIYSELLYNPQVEWGIGQVSEKQIDKINILQATRLAMEKAFHSLQKKLRKRGVEPQLVIIDGNFLINISTPQRAIVKADTTVMQCMAASIVAKVIRDRLMQKLHVKYPLYNFASHKGYGTKFHLKMLKIHGPCPIHRLTFAPCR